MADHGHKKCITLALTWLSSSLPPCTLLLRFGPAQSRIPLSLLQLVSTLGELGIPIHGGSIVAGEQLSACAVGVGLSVLGELRALIELALIPDPELRQRHATWLREAEWLFGGTPGTSREALDGVARELRQRSDSYVVLCEEAIGEVELQLSGGKKRRQRQDWENLEIS